MNDKTTKLSKAEQDAEDAKANARDLKKALAALKPFAHLPISDEQPDEAHPAYQIKVEFIRAARKLFDEADFLPASAAVGLDQGLVSLEEADASDASLQTASDGTSTTAATTRAPLA